MVSNVEKTRVKIGLVTLIKRDYLDFNDIGFAFLPTYFSNGYAYEATKTVLENLSKYHIIKNCQLSTIISIHYI